MLTGILTDTGFLKNAATTSSAIKTASDLVVKGAKPMEIINRVEGQRSVDTLKIWGLILSRLRINKNINAAVTYVTESDLKK